MPVVVLVHGGFLGPWIWRDVVARLEEAGVAAVCVDLPTMHAPRAGLDDDVRAVRDVLDRFGDVVLCGHSYAGIVVAEAAGGPHPAVRHLVFLSSAVPDVGDSLASLAERIEFRGGGEQPEELPDGRAVLPPGSAIAMLFDDCDADRAREAASLLRPSAVGARTQAVKAAAWRDVPSTYVQGSDDRLPQGLMAPGFLERVEEIVTLPTGHCPQWSRPDLVAGLLLRVVQSLP